MAKIEAMNGKEYKFTEELKKEDETPVKRKELDEAFKNFEKGDFLGDFRVHFDVSAMNVKDFQRFREISQRFFNNDDWRTLKFMIKLYEIWDHFFSEITGLKKHIKAEVETKDRDGKIKRESRETKLAQ